MADELNDLIQQTEADISNRYATDQKKQKSKRRSLTLPKVSTAFVIWMIAILLAIFEFEDVVSLVFAHADSKIESDLGNILVSAGNTLRDYQQANGSLPIILPNPSIRGLVKYERRSEFSFVLRASVGNVSMVLESDKAHPYRENRQ